MSGDNPHEQEQQTASTAKEGSHHSAQHVLSSTEQDAAFSARITSLTHSAEQQALSKTDVRIEQHTANEYSISSQAELKDHAYKHSVKQVRNMLSPSEKICSYLFHQPFIEKMSSVADRSILRPSGVLGASIVTLLGVSLSLLTSKYFGFSYSLSLFFILYGCGFGLGLATELIYRLISRNRSAR